MENKTMRLQSVGHCPAILASELKVGMRLMWNFGITTDVLAIEPKGKQSILVTEKNTKTGNEMKRTLRLTRLVVGYYPK